jgi:hypothetical protein
LSFPLTFPVNSCCSYSIMSYNEFLDWQQTKYLPRTVASPSLAAPLTLASAKQKDEAEIELKSVVEEGILSGDSLRETIDRQARDASFLNLVTERKPVVFAWRNILFRVPVKKSYFAGLIEFKTQETKDILTNVGFFAFPILFFFFCD